MNTIGRRALGIVITGALIATWALAPQISAAPTATAAAVHTVYMKTRKDCNPFPACDMSGIHLKGAIVGRPFGRCRISGTLVVPRSIARWICPGGSVKQVSTASTGAADHVRGTWKVVRGSGTGKFKGTRGGGTFSGTQSTGYFTWRGRVTY